MHYQVLSEKCMIIQLLVCKYAPKKDKTEQCMSFSGLQGARVLPFTETKYWTRVRCTRNLSLVSRVYLLDACQVHT